MAFDRKAYMKAYKAKKSSTDTAVFEHIFKEAYEAGMEALQAATPAPMVVYEADLNDKPVGQSWHVPEGLCGFAQVNIAGNTPFGRWALKNKHFKKRYETSGLYFWVSEGNQSVERKEAFARAMSRRLNDHGVTASWDSRLD